MSGPYGEAAVDYWVAGWRGILPLPPRAKKNPPSGYTGEGGVVPSYADIHAWTEGPEGEGNIALRLPRDVLGIDIDAYGQKLGASTFAAAEALHGPLPPTWRTTSRDDGVSGIRFFRVPEGLAWPGEIGPGTELIQTRHRYAVVGPSLHPDTGKAYRWINPEGLTSTAIPDPDELPALPDAWVAAFTGGVLASETARDRRSGDEAAVWIATKPGAGLEPCARMAKVPERMRRDLLSSAHNAARDGVLRAVRLSDERHRGVVEALRIMRGLFIAEATSPDRTIRGEHRRDPRQAEREWSDLLTSATNLVTANPSGLDTCDCDGQITGRIVSAAGIAPAPIEVTPTAVVVGVVEEKTDRRMRDGASFILDAPTDVPALWGEGDDVLWAEGEALMLVGPPGVGKTTLTGQILGGLLFGHGLLGLPMRPTARRVLYLAMDRPAQIARSLRRSFSEADRDVLADRLRVWVGPPPGDVARNPEILVALAVMAEADVIILDSLKDAAIGLTEDEVGGGYNRARQTALAAGVQILELHHLVKRGANGAKPNTLADVYGSAWLTAGAGSVVLLWGAAGDLVVELTHLKQPAAEVGPFKILHDHVRGISSIVEGVDVLLLVAATGAQGMTVKAVAKVMVEKDDPSANDLAKARRALERLVEAEHLEREDGGQGGGRETRRPAVYRVAGKYEASTTKYAGKYATDDAKYAGEETAGQASTDPSTPSTPTKYADTPLVKGGVSAVPPLVVACSGCGVKVRAVFAAANGGLCSRCALGGGSA